MERAHAGNSAPVQTDPSRTSAMNTPSDENLLNYGAIDLTSLRLVKRTLPSLLPSFLPSSLDPHRRVQG